MKRGFFKSIIYNGLPEGAGLREKTHSAVLNCVSLIGVIILTYFTCLNFFLGNYLVGMCTGLTATLITLSTVVVRLTKKTSIGATFISYLMLIAFSGLIYVSGKERAGHFWMLLYPLLSIFLLGLVHGSILTFLMIVSAYLFMFKIPGLQQLPVNTYLGFRAIGAYIGVTTFTVTYEVIRTTAFTQLEKTSGDLVKRRKQTEMILDNVKQGIFLLDSNLHLQDERSEYFNSLFKDASEQQSFLELINHKLPERDYVATKDYLELFFNKTVNPTLLSSINPVEKVLMNFPGDDGEITHIWLEFDFERIQLKSGETQILGLFRDVTDRVLLEEQLEREENESSKNMENLFQIIHVNPELMDEFIKDTEDEIEKINDLLKVESEDTLPIINYIFSSVHSIKGNSLLLGLTNMANKLFEFEEYIKEFRITVPTWRELLQLTVNLAELKHDIAGIKELISKIISFQNTLGEGTQNRKYIMKESISKAIDKLVVNTGKEVNLNLDNYDIDAVPEKYRRLLKDTITQMVRNSVAHGIETVEERKNRNKDPQGNIDITLNSDDTKIEFTFRDDGNGLCVERIKKAAIEKKGFSNEQVDRLSPSDAVKLIFHPGFSTASEVDNVAGQGVGMNVVKNHVDSVGGKLNIRSSVGNFCEFKILLPV